MGGSKIVMKKKFVGSGFFLHGCLGFAGKEENAIF